MNVSSALLSRYGFQLSDLRVELQGTRRESGYGTLLRQALANAGANIDRLNDLPEAQWQDALRQARCQVERIGGEGLIDPTEAELPLADIDFYLMGIVRWMNALGIHTRSCCDGHGKRLPHVSLQDQLTPEQRQILRKCTPDGVQIQFRKMSIRWNLDLSDLSPLLDIAHRLYRVWRDPAILVRHEADRWAELLIRLLNFPGVSGREGRIRAAIRRYLKPIADELFVDEAGNLCGEIRCGQGPTVLLCAHMDVSSEIEADRRILREGTVLSSSSGILGADDRAGIAVILEICRRIRKTNFKGTLKVAFTVREEVGLLGARALRADFLTDVDGAIVVDRRGTRDIVTSCGGEIAFCSELYGRLFEQAGSRAGMPDWRVTAGGSSDARVLAEKFGIETVNLSVGYQNEHTEHETVDYFAAYQTMKMIETVLHEGMIKAK